MKIILACLILLSGAVAARADPPIAVDPALMRETIAVLTKQITEKCGDMAAVARALTIAQQPAPASVAPPAPAK